MTDVIYNKIKEVLISKVRPVLNEHQGDIELLEVTQDGFVKVRLMGACSTCPGAQQTLAEVVETAIREVYPEIKGLVPVYEASEELINLALKLIRKEK
ncbi:NifU family protein [Sporomusa sp.]|uniref:NifU family protein n=1 Tax=Sporomusa sp. TaxID=2078658 RepID=UPI002B5673A0|nr:NifU family protein [Sporomusa sp.]HWR45707.1 NifU family protein [Sporomusa sp.]